MRMNDHGDIEWLSTHIHSVADTMQRNVLCWSCLLVISEYIAWRLRHWCVLIISLLGVASCDMARSLARSLLPSVHPSILRCGGLLIVCCTSGMYVILYIWCCLACITCTDACMYIIYIYKLPNKLIKAFVCFITRTRPVVHVATSTRTKLLLFSND
jgi:hypothetical protein